MAVLFGGWATAATYTLPDGPLPTGCTKGSSASVTCSSLSLAWADAVVVSNANLTLTVSNTLTIGGSNNINTSSTVSGFAIQAKTVTGSNAINLKGNVTATNALTLSSNTNSITGNVSAGGNIQIGGSVTGTLDAGGDLATQWATTLAGNATAGGNIVSGGGSTYGGNLIAGGDITSGSGDTIAGNVNSSAGAVTLKSSGTTVGGNVSAKNAIKLESGSKVAGSVISSNDKVTLEASGTTVGNGVTAKKAVILGSGCSVTGDVVTDDTVTLQSSGSQVIGNIFAKKKVTLGSSTSVTGNVTTINSDVELNSSNASVSGCVTVDSNQTLKLGWSTSAGGVCCLSGGVCSATGCVTNNSGNAAPSACSTASVSATLIAQWHFEEAATYTGTAGELLDSAGYTGGPFNGVAIGNPLPAVNPASPARTGNPGTCSYGTVPGPVANGGAFSVSGLPVSLAAGAKTSVAFWMYWDGTNGVMPIGWNLHDLWLVDGYFGFNTGNSDLFGLASTGLANGWHHVVAVFTNGSVSGNQLYIDGVSQTLSKQRPKSPSLPDAKVSTNLRIGGWAVNTSYRFSGRIDEVKLYNGALTQAQVSADFAETHACVTDPSGSVNAAGFDCLETGQNSSWNAAARRPLFTKLAGTGFGFDVVALKIDGSLEGDYVVSGEDTKYVKVDLYDDASAPACTAVTPLASPSAVVAFKSGAMVTGGRTNKTASDTLLSLTVPTAYNKLRCRVRECTDATCTGLTSLAPACSSDQFAVRPAAFLVTQNTPTLNAGSSFTLQAAAVNSNLTSTSTNYTGTPLLDRAQITGVPGFTSAALWGDLPTATAGISYATFTYDDVGSFTLPATSPGTYGISDSTFTGVDASADCILGSASNAVVASGANKGKYGCLIGQSAALTVGTFVPDHFEISDKAFSAGCTGGGFTYMDQPFSMGYKVTAKSMSRASPAVNPPGNVALMFYTGGKLNHAAINGSTDGVSKISLAASTPATPAFTNPLIPAWSNGSYSQPVTAYKFIRPTSGAVDASWGPFDALNIGVAVDDPSGAGYITGTKTFSSTRAIATACVTSGECKDFASLTTGDLPTKFRFGRLRLQNAYGSELLALPVPLAAQYWAGNYYVTNTADSCTVLPMASITMGNYLKQLSACKTQLTPTGNVALVAGKLPGTGLVLTKPGAGNAGSVDLAINVSATAAGNTCVGASESAASAANMPWFGPNLGARATFGIYKSPLIYRRENY